MSRRDRTDDSVWLLVPAPVRKLPADLAAVVIVTVLVCLSVLVPGVSETPLRLLFGLPFLLFLPGYALIAALFPEGKPDADSEGAGIDGVERVALSIGMSLAAVPLLGVILNFTPWGIRLVPILVVVSLFTVGMVVVGAARRQALPPEERLHVPYREWLETGRKALFSPSSQLDGALNVLLAASMLLALGAVGYAVMFPPQGESFTEFYILSEDEDGELVAADYPSEFTLGESQPVVVGIENHEGESVEYSVVVQLQEVETVDNETRIRENEELDRFSSPTVADGDSWERDHDIQPTMTGEDLRVQYLLYRGEPPSEPSEENAYRDLHLWIDVES